MVCGAGDFITIRTLRGVDGRNRDNTPIRRLLGWEPSTTLRTGMERTYRWIDDPMTVGLVIAGR